MSDVDDGEEVVSHSLYYKFQGKLVYPEKCFTVLITNNEDD